MARRERNEVQALAWLRVTNYLRGWLDQELSCRATVHGRRVVCIRHLEGAREVLKMEAADDVLVAGKIQNTMSATRMNIVQAGMALDEGTVARLYGVTRQDVEMFVPIETGAVAMTKDGVLRPWTTDTAFGQRQASAMLQLLRRAFWQGVAEFDREYARRMDGEPYPAVDMIEAWCKHSGTSEVYLDALRREWQRKVKREAGK